MQTVRKRDKLREKEGSERIEEKRRGERIEKERDMYTHIDTHTEGESKRERKERESVCV